MPKIDAAQQWSVRVYSSQPERFATLRRDALCDAPQMQKVIAAGVPVLVDGEDQMRASFPDHERILSLGCASVLNTPIRIRHHAVANVNLMRAAGRYPLVDNDAMRFANIACQMVSGSIIRPGKRRGRFRITASSAIRPLLTRRFDHSSTKRSSVALHPDA